MSDMVTQASEPKHRLRWYQFSLGSLLLLMTALCIALGIWQCTRHARGPALLGRIHDHRGRPIAGVKVVVWTGAASWWKAYETYTDEDGRYRLSPVKGAMEWNAQDEAFHMFRIKLEHARFESEHDQCAVLSLPDRAGYRFVRDFTMSPRSKLCITGIEPLVIVENEEEESLGIPSPP